MTDPQLQILLLNIARQLEEAVSKVSEYSETNLDPFYNVLDDIKADAERLDHVEMEVGDVKFRCNMDKKEINDDE